jgi:hypothetical protein
MTAATVHIFSELFAAFMLSVFSGGQVHEESTAAFSVDRARLCFRSRSTCNPQDFFQRSTHGFSALRTILNLRQVAAVENSIVVQDTPENIAFAERIVPDLENPSTR